MITHIFLALIIVSAVPLYILMLNAATAKKVSVFSLIFSVVTFKDVRDRWIAAYRRKRYDALKKMVVDEHLQGFQGMVVPKKYGMKEVKQYFQPPMYQIARNNYKQLCLFWRKDLMEEEVGLPFAERVANAAVSTDGAH